MSTIRVAVSYVHLSIEVSSFVQLLTTPTTGLEQNVASNVVWRMMHKYRDNSVVVTSGGKVCIHIRTLII